MKKISLTILFCFTLSIIGKAQSMLSSGSIYSYYGIGTLNDYRDPAAAGMGLTGIAVFDHSSNLSNPAIWGNAFYTEGTGGFFIKTINSSDNNGNVIKTNVDASPFELVFPVKRSQIGVSLGLYQLSKSDYNYSSLGTMSSGVTYTNQNHASGGINALELGFGWKILKNLSIGYAPSVVFGDLKNSITTSFSDANYQSTHFIKSNSNIGFGNRFGLYYQKGQVFDNHDLIALGATVNLPVKLHSKNTIDYFVGSSSGGVINTTQSLNKGSMRLPLKMGFGISYWASNRWMFGSEVLYQKWSDFKNIEGQTPAYMKNRTRFGLGVQLLPSRNNSSNLLRHLTYRMGFSYDSGYLKLNSRNIQGWNISAGLGIPAIPTQSSSSINIDFNYGMRGTLINSLVKERIFSIRLSFNLSELMFLQPKIQ